jgi:diaminopimelate decarboxylase
VPAKRIVFSGVGKTRAEMADALEAGVLQINVESLPELEQLDEVARRMGVRAPVALRVNPDVDAHTHAKISTGRREDKFGIEWTRAHEVYTRAANMAGIELAGLAVHIGSQLTDLEPFREAFVRLGDLVAILRADGHEIRRLDLGGGLGIPYDSGEIPSPEEYGAIVKETVSQLNCELLFEPGRVILGNAGILVTRVLYVKEGETRRFAIIDAAMNDLMRPTLYDAYHDVVPVTEPAGGAERQRYDVVGPICETGDTLARDRELPKLAADDLIAIRTAGAYGAAMSSTYNSRALVPEVLVKGGEFAVIRARMDVREFLARESIPAWLADDGKGGSS